VTRLSVQHGFFRGVGWGLALASAIWLLVVFTRYSNVYETGLGDVTRSLAFVRFDPVFLYIAVGVWFAAALGSRMRRPHQGPGLPVAAPRVVSFGEPLDSVACIECGSVSDTNWSGWRACRTEDPEGIEAPEISFFCPECAYREFGRQTPKRRP
jgi:hypothetical protein